MQDGGFQMEWNDGMVVGANWWEGGTTLIGF